MYVDELCDDEHMLFWMFVIGEIHFLYLDAVVAIDVLDYLMLMIGYGYQILLVMPGILTLHRSYE